jgi:transcription elongation GreA/GreB family factor
MDKKALKESLYKVQELMIKDLKMEIDSIHGLMDLDEEDTMDPEDFSHQTEAGTMVMTLKERLRVAEEQLKVIDTLTEDKMDEIGPGTIVETKNRRLYISISSRPFIHDGKEIIPISTKAPICQSIMGMKIGDQISLGVNEETITAIT